MRFYLVSRDGVPFAAYVTAAQRAGAVAILPNADGVHRFGGAVYALTDVDAEPWPADGSESFGETPAAMVRRATAMLTEHGHAWRFSTREDRELTRSNCGACALSGYGLTDRDIRRCGPDYAGWARVYVQAGRPVPIGWSAPLWRELAGAGRIDPDGQTGDANDRYGNALRRDVATFGLMFATPDGRTVDGSAVRR